MTSIRRVHGTTDLIPLVPHLIGMTPVDSVVLIPLTGNRTQGALRANRPTGLDIPTTIRTAAHLIGMLCNLDTVDSLLPLIYTPHTIAAATEDRILLAALVDRALAAGFEVPDAVLIGADGWIAVDDDPTTPNPHVTTVVQDLPPLLDPTQAGSIRPADPDASTALDAHRHDARIIAAAAFHSFDPTDAIETAITSTTPSALLACLSAIPTLRDLVLLQTGWGHRFGQDAWRRTVLDPNPLGMDEDAAVAYRGGNFRRPDVDRIRALITALQATAPAASTTERTGITAMLAWLHWSLGASTIAGHLATAALATDPGHGLARIIDGLISHGTLPEWAWRAQPRP